MLKHAIAGNSNQKELSRWTPLRPHPIQNALWHTNARFVCVPAGRRSGKTELAKRYVAIKAIAGNKDGNARFFLAAPTRDQAKRIFWGDMKKLIPKKLMRKTPSESELSIHLANGSEIVVLGMDKPQRIEGTPWDGGVLDEYADMKAEAWKQNVSPALSDRFGWCWFTGVPNGRNHYWDLCQFAEQDDEWEVFTWISADILPASEIESARRRLDEQTFKQEYEASFINSSGQAYTAFDYKVHAVDVRYSPDVDLCLCFDFNVSPGIAVICQELDLPSGERGTAIVDEVWIGSNSTTELVCREILKKYSNHSKNVFLYGDASGGNSGSAKLNGSDWDIIKNVLGPVYGRRLMTRVPRSNPAVRSRINAVNSRLKSAAGNIRMGINPHTAKHTLRDFEVTSISKSSLGELDKSNKDATHLTDAVGYYVFFEFPIDRGIIAGGNYSFAA